MNEMDENCEGILPGQAVNIMKCDVVQIEFIYLIKFTLMFFLISLVTICIIKEITILDRYVSTIDSSFVTSHITLR